MLITFCIDPKFATCYFCAAQCRSHTNILGYMIQYVKYLSCMRSNQVSVNQASSLYFLISLSSPVQSLVAFIWQNVYRIIFCGSKLSTTENNYDVDAKTLLHSSLTCMYDVQYEPRHKVI